MILHNKKSAHNELLRQLCLIPFTPKLSQLSAKVHEEIYHLLKRRNAEAELLCEEPDLFQLYLSFILIRSKTLTFEEMDEGAQHVIRMEIVSPYPQHVALA